jgi:hypothetical protein
VLFTKHSEVPPFGAGRLFVASFVILLFFVSNFVSFLFLRAVSANSGVSLGVDVIDDVVEMRVLRTHGTKWRARFGNHIWSTDRIKNTLLAETFVVKKSAPAPAGIWPMSLKSCVFCLFAMNFV